MLQSLGLSRVGVRPELLDPVLVRPIQLELVRPAQLDIVRPIRLRLEKMDWISTIKVPKPESTLIISDSLDISLFKPTPNYWWRFWQYLFFGFKWKKGQEFVSKPHNNPKNCNKKAVESLGSD